MVVRITKKNNPEQTKKALEKLAISSNRKKKSLSDFYGKMRGAFGNGLAYQKKLRDEWT
jgi:hypothetical protein